MVVVTLKVSEDHAFADGRYRPVTLDFTFDTQTPAAEVISVLMAAVTRIGGVEAVDTGLPG